MALWWQCGVPEIDTFCVCDDLIDPAVAGQVFGGGLMQHRLGKINEHANIFGAASWLTAAAGEGSLALGAIGVPVLMPRRRQG